MSSAQRDYWYETASIGLEEAGAQTHRNAQGRALVTLYVAACAVLILAAVIAWG